MCLKYAGSKLVFNFSVFLHFVSNNDASFFLETNQFSIIKRKLSLFVGSCQLTQHLWSKERSNSRQFLRTKGPCVLRAFLSNLGVKIFAKRKCLGFLLSLNRALFRCMQKFYSIFIVILI